MRLLAPTENLGCVQSFVRVSPHFKVAVVSPTKVKAKNTILKVLLIVVFVLPKLFVSRHFRPMVFPGSDARYKIYQYIYADCPRNPCTKVPRSVPVILIHSCPYNSHKAKPHQPYSREQSKAHPVSHNMPFPTPQAQQHPLNLQQSPSAPVHPLPLPPFAQAAMIPGPSFTIVCTIAVKFHVGIGVHIIL